MFKISLCAVLILLASSVMADDCEPAVDAASLMNANEKPCDYTNSGLNGVLHRAMANKKANEATQSESTAKSSFSSSASSVQTVSSLEKPNAMVFVKSGQAKTAEELQLLRFKLLQESTAICANGLVVTSEQYNAAPNSLKLLLQLRCL